ncbi:MAG: lipopolysaccharide biosynthesis protein [Nitrospinaceae bacterium]
MSSFQRFLTNISWNVFGKICVQLILFAVSILLTRYLGRERLGVYATLLVIPAFVRLVNQFGLETLINKKLPELQVRDPSGKQGRFLVRLLIRTRLLSSLAFCGILYIALPFYLDWVQHPELLKYRPALIFYFLAITVNSLLSTLLMTLLRYKLVAALETLSALLNLILLGVFIFLDAGIAGVLYAYILSTFVNIFVSAFMVRKEVVGPAAPPPWGEMKKLAWVSYWITLFSFGLMVQSDVVMMNYFQVDNVRVGYYHLATGLGAMLAFVLTGVGPLGLSILSSTHARESREGLSRVWCEIVGFAAFLTTPIFVFAFFNAEPLIAFVYGKPFAGAAAALSFYVVFLGAAAALGTDFTVSTLFILQKRKTALQSNIEGSVINVLLNLVLIPRYGELGAVAATGSVMVYMVIRQLYAIQKEITIRPVFRTLSRCLFFSLAAVLPAELVARVVADHILLNAGVYLVSFFFLLVWIKPFTEDHRRLVAGIHPGLDPWFRRFAVGSGSEAR